MPAPAIKKIKGKIIERKVADLTPHPDNVREHGEEQLDLLIKSITEFGFTVPVLVDEDGTILAGHGRVEAAKQMGLAKVPTLDVAHLTDAQKKAFLIADNKLYERGGWKPEALEKLVLELNTMDINLEVTGLEPDVLHDMLRAERTGFLDAGEIAPRDRTRSTTRTNEFVQLNFTLSPDDRKTVMDVLKREQQRLGLATSGEALVALCTELSGNAEN